MSHPSVNISEIIEGPLPVRSTNLNRIGLVGTSRKGKYGSAVLVQSDDELDSKVGRTLDMGSVGLQVVRDEGGSDNVFVRVMGRGRLASTFMSITNPDKTSAEVDTLTLTVKANAADASPKVYTAPVAAGTVLKDALNALVTAVASDPTAIVAVALDLSGAGRLLITAKTPGTAGNDIMVKLVESSATDDFIEDITEFINLLGGQNPPAAAQATRDSVKLVAISEGLAGNLISYQIVAGEKTGTVDLLLTDNSVSPVVKEKFLLDFTLPASLINTNEFAATRGSSLVRAFYVGAGTMEASKVPATMSSPASLAGGVDGASSIDETDYIDALKVLAKTQCNIILAPGQTSAMVRAALIKQAEDTTILEGLRIAVINAPKALIDVPAVKAATEGLASADGSAVMVAGWATYVGQSALAELSVSPDAFYAGHLAATPAHVSPAARSSSPFLRSAVAVDTVNTETMLHAYTDARLEALIVDPTTGGFHCLNGRTLASNAAHYYVCIRRMANRIKTDIFFASQPLKSEPKNDNLMASVKGMITSYLDGLTNVGQIRGGGVRNVAKTTNGLRLDFDWLPVYPADQIDYGMYRQAIDV